MLHRNIPLDTEQPVTIRNLDALLAPKTVALIGASPRRGSIGHTVMTKLLNGGFKGDVHLVNPKYDAIEDHPCHASVADLPTTPDLGVIVTPPDSVPGLIGELGAKGARAAVVITAGLTRENGLRQAMLDAAKPHLLRVLGPNCIGLQAPCVGLDASFAHIAAAPGDLALLSQSGAIVTAMLDWAAPRGIGFSVVASLGDMADVDVGDMLDHLAADRATHAVIMYLEQVTDARKFMSAARSCARVKPVIVVKAGRSAAAAKAAASHTGALAGADAVYETAFRRAGVLRVETLKSLFAAAETLARVPPLRSDRLGIVTNGGGAGVLAVDALAQRGIRLAALSDVSMAALDAALPATWSHANPVDVIGDADADRYEAAVTTLLDDPKVDAVLVMNCPTALAPSDVIAERVVALAAARAAMPGQRPRKPILTNWLGEATAAVARKRFEAAGLPSYDTPAEAARGFSYLANHHKAQAALRRVPPSLPPDFSADYAAAKAAMAPALAEGRETLTEPEAKAVLRAYGVPTAETETASTPQEAGEIAGRMLEAGVQAVAVKILSRDITHKSDVGGVRLNLHTAQEAAAAAEGILAAARKARPDAQIDGLAVQPMIRREHAHELILGVTEDATFGPVMLFGAGGVSVEVVADKALALPPLDRTLARDMIEQTRVGKLMAGYRDRPAADIDAVALTLVRLARLAADFPQIIEMDVNPLLADASGVIALDARIVARPAPQTERGANPRFALRPYPAQWDRPETLPDGSTVRVRPVLPQDAALYEAFFDRLTDQDRRFRFMSAINQLSQSQIARFTQVDYARAMAFVAIDPEDGSLMGVSRLAADPDGERAEYAVIARSDLKGKGLGRALMTRLLDYAAAEGIGEIWGYVDIRNEAMQALCAKLGFRHRTDPDDREHVIVSVRPTAEGPDNASTGAPNETDAPQPSDKVTPA